MTVAEFLAWCPDDGRRWQLVDGSPRAMAPAKRTHGAIQSELARLLGNHLAALGGDCSVLVAPGVVPRVLSGHNMRVPDLAVTCSAYGEEESSLDDPVLTLGILSPGSRAETWANVWAHTSLPSVREILVVHSTAVGAELLRRGADGSWPPEPLRVGGDDALVLEGVGFRAPLRDLYRTTRPRPRG